MKYSIVLCVIGCFVNFLPTLSAQTTLPEMIQGAPLKFKIEHEGKAHGVNAGYQYTSITTTPDGTVYSGWIDDQLQLRLAQIATTGDTKEAVLKEGIREDRYHVKPSVAVDNNGYIHIAADMHNQPWVYYRSVQPHSIDEFEQIQPPGIKVTYPQFFKDIHGELYLTFRHKVKPDPNAWTPGSSAGAVARYDVETHRFTMLGGEDHRLLKTLVWVDNGGVDGHYQQPGLRLHFDSTNRMHLVATLINEPTDRAWNGHTHVLYAYSDDGGETFHRLGGEKIESLPMGPDSMTTVAYRSENDIYANAFIGAFSPNEPVVMWEFDEGCRIQAFDGTGWKTLLVDRSQFSRTMLTLRDGRLVLVDAGGDLLVSPDRGESFVHHASSHDEFASAACMVDREHLLQTGYLRCQFTPRGSNRIIAASAKVNDR